MSNYKTGVFRRLRLFALALVFGLGVVTIIGTGGGGGGGDSSESLTYSGVTTSATLTETNATTMVSDVLFGGDFAGGASPLSLGSTEAARSIEIGGLVAHALRDVSLSTFEQFLQAHRQNATSLQRAPVSVNKPLACDNPEGSGRVTGTIDDVTLTGELTFTYSNCSIDGITYDGSGKMAVAAVDTAYFVPTRFTVIFELMKLSSAEFRGAISGTINVRIMIYSNEDQMTLKVVAKDNLSGKMYWYNSLKIESTYDNIFFPITHTHRLTGRVYDSKHGYVDAETNVPLSYSSISAEFPDVEGTMHYFGAASAVIEMIVEPGGNEVTLRLDLDGDGGYELEHTMSWMDLVNQVPIPTP